MLGQWMWNFIHKLVRKYPKKFKRLLPQTKPLRVSVWNSIVIQFIQFHVSINDKLHVENFWGKSDGHLFVMT